MYKIYWTTPINNEAFSEDFDDMSLALERAKLLRESGRTFVTMVSENPNSVGKPGVDSVVDGILPDGNIYEWKMRR
mgnify:CR=1 FL=1